MPTEVLGTPIATLAPHDGAAFLISDLHVPADGGRALHNLDLALAAAVAERSRLFVLGDLFDSYVTKRQIEVGSWRLVAERLRAVVAAGVAVDVLRGNRDFLLGPEFEAASGARLHDGGVRVRLGGVDTLLLHGDELCQNDLPYQRAKRWLRSAPTRAIARRLPLALALKAAARARRRSAAVIASGDQTRFLPTRAAVEAAFAIGVERLVFGHIHRQATGPFGAGRYWVLPAFDAERAVGLRVVDGDFGPVQFQTGAATAAVAAGEPCPFPA
ncbi:MAG: UDP-2,3-diacylglucosamine diphosphatase [Planctomycetes bacterium]|nr:UDP-2,3-diacylglucosamine diphosphatase [Planctomycetota bacterium]